MLKPSIFISRDSERCKAFIDIIQDKVSRVKCESLLEFSMIKSTGLPSNGWLFFYSQTGVDYFLKQHTKAQIASADLKIAAFGPKTAQHIQNKSIAVNFIGTGEAGTTAALFLRDNKLSNVCFIKGRHSKESLNPLLTNTFEITSIDVYDNKSKTNFNLPQSDILVFTSPLNLKTYCQQYPIVSDQKVVTIGISTATTALELGIEEVHIPTKPSLESLATLAGELCDTWCPGK